MDTPLTGALLVGRIRIIDATQWAEYVRRVPATLVPWGATLLARGTQATVLTGTTHETDVVLIRFPTRTAITDWYRSDAYQALVPLRDAAAEVVIVGYAL